MLNEIPLNISIDEKYFKDDEEYSITSILGKENLEEIQNIISEATGLAFVTVDFRGNPITEKTKFTPYCQLIRKNPLYENICKLSDASGAILSAASKKTSIYFCPFGLLEIALPVIINGRYLGGFIGGQVRCFDAPKNTHQIDKNLLPEGPLENSEELEEAKKSTKIYSYEEFVAISKLIEWIISQLTKRELISSHHEAKNKKEIAKLKDRLIKKDLEIQNLQVRELSLSSSFNKYFFNNVISSISNLSIIENAPRTNKFIILYKKYLEVGLKEGKIELKEFLELMNSYLEMSKFRFEDKFFYEVKVEKELDTIKVESKFILPFIQYLVFYGLRLKDTVYNLKIDINRDNKNLYFNISDDGPGYKKDELQREFNFYDNEYEGKEFLDTIYELMDKIVLIYGDEYSVKIEAEKDKGTNILLRFPI